MPIVMDHEIYKIIIVRYHKLTMFIFQNEILKLTMSLYINCFSSYHGMPHMAEWSRRSYAIFCRGYEYVTDDLFFQFLYMQ